MGEDSDDEDEDEDEEELDAEEAAEVEAMDLSSLFEPETPEEASRSASWAAASIWCGWGVKSCTESGPAALADSVAEKWYMM